MKRVVIQRALAAIALIGALIAPEVWAYGQHDLTQVVRTVEGPQGRKRQLDMGVVNAIIGDLARHAHTYPTQFKDDKERQRATQDAGNLSGMLNILTSSGSVQPELLLSVGRLNAMAHNLDVSGAAQRADAAFQQLLMNQPEHPQGNYEYGLFLASSSRPKAAIPYLEKAMTQGVDAAPYTLDLAYLALNDKRKALESFHGYTKKHPEDGIAQRLTKTIREGYVDSHR